MTRETLFIEAMGARGDGLARLGEARLIVPLTLPGERVTVQREGERAQLLEILEASPERATPDCRHFGTCGGCAVQHWQAGAVAEWKRARVQQALARAGVEAGVRPPLDAHGAGRRRISLHVRYPKSAGGRIEAGFMQARSHALVDLDRCPLLVPGLAGAADLAREIGHVLRGWAKPLDVQATAVPQGLDVDLRGTGALPEALRRKLIELATARDLARLSLHGERLIEARIPALSPEGLTLFLPPGSFLQATGAAEEILAAFALSALTDARHVADLFCGLGPFALRLSRRVKVSAFDSDQGAIAALNRSLRANGGGRPLVAQVRDLFRRPLFAPELQPFDAVLLDPPRQGAQAQCREIAKSRVARVVFIACDPESFARDARILVDAGFRLGPVTPVDQFRHSPHIELMAVLER